MSETDKRKFFFKLLTLAVLITSLAFLTGSKTSGFLTPIHKTANSPRSSQPLKAIAQVQPDSPLKISSMIVKSVDPLEPEVSYMITNTGKKPINAFAVREVVIFGHAQSEGVDVSNSLFISSIVQPGQSLPGSVEGESYSDAVQSITLIIDFVEFTDGTIWGDDKFKSSERLDGQRAGAQAEVERLRKIEKERGAAALASAVAEEETEITPSADKSPAWQNGFSEGVSSEHQRLQRANAKNGSAGIQAELQKPFDVSNRRTK